MSAFAWAWPTETSDLHENASKIGRALNIPKPIAMALAGREIGLETAQLIGDRSLAECTREIGDPDLVEAAAERLLAAGQRGTIGVLCDYDVDGATSQAILIEALRAALPNGPDPVVTVPHRNTEGFGPNPRCMAELASAGVSGIAVLDCGTAAGRLLDRFHRESGAATVVVDHHPPHGRAVPESAVLVNPWVSREPDPAEQGTLCAAGLTWFLALAILRQAGLSAVQTVQVRKRITLFAALGTACDMMPVDRPFNRSLLRMGIRLMGDPGAVPPGIQAVADVAGIWSSPSLEDFAWRIGPRLNAGSRMGKSDLASHCLRATTRSDAQSLAHDLESLNRKRVQMGRQANREVNADDLRDRFARGPFNVHRTKAATPGTAGLVASSIVKQFGWPAVSLAERDDGNLAGSGRSSLGFNIGLAVSEADRAGLLVSGGGHAAACGVVLRAEHVGDFTDFMVARFEARKGSGGHPSEPTHFIDARLRANSLGPRRILKVANEQARMAPWGPGLKAPLFGIRDCRVAWGRILRGDHLLLTIESDSEQFEAVWWNPPLDWTSRMDLESPQEIRTGSGGPVGNFDLAGALEANEWRGRRTGRIVVRDARPLRA